MRENWRFAVGIILLSTAMGAATVTPLFGQGHGRRPPDGGHRGPGAPQAEHGRPGPPQGGDHGPGRQRGRYGGSSDSQSRLERYDTFLKGFDANRNGQIDEKEAEGPRAYFVRRLAERAKMESKFPISIDKLREGLKTHYFSYFRLRV